MKDFRSVFDVQTESLFCVKNCTEWDMGCMKMQNRKMTQKTEITIGKKGLKSKYEENFVCF